MTKNLIKLLIVFVVCVSLFAFPLSYVSAQKDAYPSLYVMSDVANQDAQETITFAQFEQEDVTLTGPYDGFTVLFGLPADWKLSDGAEIELSMGISFNSTLNSTGASVLSGGLMTVRLNSITVGILSLDQVGEVTHQLSIPAAALQSRRTDGRMELSLVLDAGFSCDYDQQMIVLVHPTSNLTFPHQSVAPDTNLVKFPSPIYQNSVFKDKALIVIPDEPSEAELQSALTVAAGLGNLSKNNLTLDLATASEITPEQLANNNLLLIGKAQSLALYRELELPLLVDSTGFQLSGGSPDDGVIQMVNSSWSSAHVVLVISGNTDNGVVKAAQALSTGVLRPNRLPNLSIIDAVQSRSVPSVQPVDQTLAELGYETELIEGRGLNILSYEFYIPPGWTTASDAYFELIFAHSALINLDRSGLIVSLNGVPIGSAKLTETTAANTKNQVNINLPASEIISGINTLDIQADLLPLDNCSTPNLQGIWATVWAESKLHLPLLETSFDPRTIYDLTTFPYPFTFDITLGNTAFVLPRNDINTWRSALRIAEYLGDQGNPPLVMLKLFYGDDLPENEKENFNFLVVGRATQLPFINEINSSLPAPFIENTDIAREDSMQVIFRLPAEAPQGYLQLLASPWNNEHVILAVLGTTDQGVIWSGSALIDPPMRSQIAGNFSVINDQQVVTTDTRLPGLIEQPTLSAEVSDVNQPDLLTPQPSNSQYERPVWILVALGISTAIAIAVLIIVIYTSIVRNQLKRPKNKIE